MLAPADAGSMACDNEYTIKQEGNQQASKDLVYRCSFGQYQPQFINDTPSISFDSFKSSHKVRLQQISAFFKASFHILHGLLPTSML